MFNLSEGMPICKIVGESKLNNKVVYLDENTDSDYIKCVAEIQLEGDNKFELIPNTTLLQLQL